jgi:hypothetical protein
MIHGTTNTGIDKPAHNGVYAAEVYFGWKLLQFKDGEWWHMDCVGRWTASLPLQWVGPLPARRGEERPQTKPTPKMEFDL